ncbi:uncharacterized protein LOC144440245 [Glandiceps talaboti]
MDTGLRRSKRKRISRKPWEESRGSANMFTKQPNWSMKEKQALLDTLQKNGNHENYVRISRVIRTKTPQEVKAYMEFLQRKARMSALSTEDEIFSVPPLQKWLNLASELSKLKGADYTEEIGKVMKLACLGEDSPGSADTLGKTSLPAPNYPKIYEYLSDLLAGKEPRQLSATDSWVVHDILQNLECEIKQSNTKEQEKFLKSRCHWLMCKLYKGDPNLELDKKLTNELTGILLPGTTYIRPPASSNQGPAAAVQRTSTATRSATITSDVLTRETPAVPQSVTGIGEVSVTNAAAMTATTATVTQFPVVRRVATKAASATTPVTPLSTSVCNPTVTATQAATSSYIHTIPKSTVNQTESSNVVQPKTAMSLATPQTHAAAAALLALSTPPQADQRTTQPPLSVTAKNTSTEGPTAASQTATPAAQEHITQSLTASNRRIVGEAMSATTTVETPSNTMLICSNPRQDEVSTTAVQQSTSESFVTATVTEASTSRQREDATNADVVPTGLGTLNPFSIPIRLLNILSPP